MRRRALLSGTAAVSITGLSGCLGDVRRQVSGEIRWDHAAARTHDARDAFVRGGLTAREDDSLAAWVFPEAPPTDVTVFSDVLGDEVQRQWDNEVHNENYESLFGLLFQVRSPREYALGLGIRAPEDPSWAGLDEARLPVSVESSPLDTDEFPDAEYVTTTSLTYFAASHAPSSAEVPVYQSPSESGTRTDGSDEQLVTTVDAGRWTPP